MPRTEALTPLDCMRLLGLGEATTLKELKRRYRLLAIEYHPDKHGGNEISRRRFAEIAAAYRTLKRTIEAHKAGRAVGACYECGEFDEVRVGMDGHPRCDTCALNGPRRMLPLPTFVIVRCVGTVVMLAVAAWLLLQALSSGRASHALLALLAGMGALLVLAGTCLRVVYCISPRHRR